ncbi:unnamed protein product [Closterium sp. NIES-65]|nr:unnamed protein product [Closterium sp. NIES-65]
MAFVQKGSSSLQSTHGRLGLAVLLLIFLQPIIGQLRPVKGHVSRRYWFALHWVVGVAIVAMAWSNMFLGLDLASSRFGYNLEWYYIAFAVMIVTFESTQKSPRVQFLFPVAPERLVPGALIPMDAPAGRGVRYTSVTGASGDSISSAGGRFSPALGPTSRGISGGNGGGAPEDRARRVKSLLEGYYGHGGGAPGAEDASGSAAGSSGGRDDINSRAFDADSFVANLIRQAKLDDLLQKHVSWAAEIKNLDSDMQMLVYENYSKFISATDTIRTMKDNVASMESSMDQLLLPRIHSPSSILPLPSDLLLFLLPQPPHQHEGQCGNMKDNVASMESSLDQLLACTPLTCLFAVFHCPSLAMQPTISMKDNVASMKSSMGQLLLCFVTLTHSLPRYSLSVSPAIPPTSMKDNVASMKSSVGPLLLASTQHPPLLPIFSLPSPPPRSLPSA